MSSFIDRLKQGRLWDFPGGVFPEQFKALSNQVEIADIALPEYLYVPVKQHIGVEGKLVVEAGSKVLKGQPLTQSSNPFAVPVHAPTSGEVVAITGHVSAHPSGFAEQTVVIKPDGLETWTELSPLQDYKSLPKTDVVETLSQAGIAGMGGAGFPTHIKLSSHKQIDTLIINGVECEPYITSDDRLMREHAWQIRQGIDVLCHLLSPKTVIIAIEDNKPEAISAMEVACQDEDNYLVCHVPTKYPAGGEKQLIQLLTGKEIPQNGLPIDLGMLMQNVGTCFAIADAIFAGKPLIQRVVTLTGKALNAPANVWALLGTPISHLLMIGQYQSKKQKQQRAIMGGPMMGFTIASDKVPVVKITNCLLVPTDKELPLPQEEMPCIRCGACADACPAGLLPQQLYWHSKAGELEQAQAFNIADCIECGACAFVCPSSIPLVHYYRQTKADIKLAEEQKRKAEQAKERFNARQERLEREKAERDAKRSGGATSRRNTSRQTATEPAESNPNSGTETPAANSVQTTEKRSGSDSASKVAAAIARAKAKKAQAEAQNQTQAPTQEQTQEQSQGETETLPAQPEPNSNKARVAAAIARAKAKKAQQAQLQSENADNQEAGEHEAKPASALLDDSPPSASEPTVPTENPETPEPPETSESKGKSEADDKKARVAAAIARAKAKKAQAQPNETTQATEPAVEISAEKPKQKAVDKPADMAQNAPQEPIGEPVISPEEAEKAKQARIAEAIARAKARKKQSKPKPADEPSYAQTGNSGLKDPLSDDAEAQRRKRVEAAIAKAKARQQERRQSGKSSHKNTDNSNSTGEQ